MEIKNAKFVTSMAQYGRFTGIGLPQIAVAGKSNVGKSSLINALCRNGKLANMDCGQMHALCIIGGKVYQVKGDTLTD